MTTKPARYWSQSTLSGGCNKAIDFIQQGWAPAREDNFLSIGSALHLYDALRAQGVDEMEATMKARALVASEKVKPTIPWLKPSYVHDLCESWEAEAKHRNKVLLKPDGTPCVEFSMAYPIRETPEVVDIATGTLDGIEILPTDYLAIRDTKTTMKWEIDLRLYERSSQFLHYPWILRAFSLARPGSWVAREVFPRLKCVTIYSVKLLKDRREINQHTFNINWQLVDEYGDLLKRFVKSFVPGLQNGIITGTCMSGKDYPCQFFDLCHTKRTENYVQRTYDPIRRHTGSHVSNPANSENAVFAPAV